MNLFRLSASYIRQSGLATALNLLLLILGVGTISLLLILGAGLLIVGEWHFVSDVIAGTVLGVSIGLLAGELWLAHAK